MQISSNLARTVPSSSRSCSFADSAARTSPQDSHRVVVAALGRRRLDGHCPAVEQGSSPHFGRLDSSSVSKCIFPKRGGCLRGGDRHQKRLSLLRRRLRKACHARGAPGPLRPRSAFLGVPRCLQAAPCRACASALHLQRNGAGLRNIEPSRALRAGSSSS